MTIKMDTPTYTSEYTFHLDTFKAVLPYEIHNALNTIKTETVNNDVFYFETAHYDNESESCDGLVVVLYVDDKYFIGDAGHSDEVLYSTALKHEAVILIYALINSMSNDNDDGLDHYLWSVLIGNN